MPTPAMTALPQPRTPWSMAAGLLCCAAAALASAGSHATQTSAAAASALKVLSTPLPDAPGASPAAGMAATAAKDTHTGASITVQKGESIDAAIRRGLPGLILNEEFLRQALARANPGIFPRGRTFPVRPGTVLALPSHDMLRQQILAQYPQTAALLQAPAEAAAPAEANTGPDKRRWVRFP